MFWASLTARARRVGLKLCRQPSMGPGYTLHPLARRWARCVLHAVLAQDTRMGAPAGEGGSAGRKLIRRVNPSEVPLPRLAQIGSCRRLGQSAALLPSLCKQPLFPPTHPGEFVVSTEPWDHSGTTCAPCALCGAPCARLSPRGGLFVRLAGSILPMNAFGREL